MALAQYSLTLSGQAPFYYPLLGRDKKWRQDFKLRLSAELRIVGSKHGEEYYTKELKYKLVEFGADGYVYYSCASDTSKLYSALLDGIAFIDGNGWRMVDVANHLAEGLGHLPEIAIPLNDEQEYFLRYLIARFVEDARR